MLMIIISSIILLVIPTFLALLLNKKTPLSPKYLSLGMLLSVITILKLPFLAFASNQPLIVATIISSFFYILAESLVRVYLHRRHSHQTINNILSIALGYVSLKFVAIFLFQLYNFIQLSVSSSKYPELFVESMQNVDTNILYIGQVFHSAYIFLYCLLLLLFIVIECKQVKHFIKIEILFFTINFLIICLMTTMNILSTYPAYFNIYFYFNIFLLTLFITALVLIYQFTTNVNSKRT